MVEIENGDEGRHQRYNFAGLADDQFVQWEVINFGRAFVCFPCHFKNWQRFEMVMEDIMIIIIVQVWQMISLWEV